METVDTKTNTTGYGFKQTTMLVKPIRCPENRFGNDTVGRGLNLTESWCPDIINFTLQGNLGTRNKNVFMANLGFCN